VPARRRPDANGCDSAVRAAAVSSLGLPHALPRLPAARTGGFCPVPRSGRATCRIDPGCAADNTPRRMRWTPSGMRHPACTGGRGRAQC
jgi:hypothetical protein